MYIVDRKVYTMNWGCGHPVSQRHLQVCVSETRLPVAQWREKASFLLDEPSWGRLLVHAHRLNQVSPRYHRSHLTV